MKRTLFIISVALFPLLCSAEVYNCNGTWSSKSCGADSQPVQNLRGLSRLNLTTQTSTAATAQTIPVVSSQSVPKEKPEMECIAVPGGAKVDVLGLSTRRTEDSELSKTSLVGTVRNNSNQDVNSPVYARLRTLGTDKLQFIKIADALIAAESVRFAVPVKITTKNERHTGTLMVQLVHRFPMDCREYKVGLADASLAKGFSHGPSTFVDGTGLGFEKQLLKSQASIRKEVGRLRTKYSSVDFQGNGDLIRERTHIRTQLNHVCSQNLIKHFDKVSDNCLELDRLIKEIGK